MKIKKRDGSMVPMKFDKINQRLKNLLTSEMKKTIDIDIISQKTIDCLYDGIDSSEIDTIVSETAVGMSTVHPDHEELASRVVATRLRKIVPPNFSDAMMILFQRDILSEEVWDAIEAIGRSTVNEAIVHSRDMNINYFGIKTLERSYLQRVDGALMETPQYMWMRVSIGIHGNNWEMVKETYDHMSQGYFTHATPTLFNAGTPRPQCSSCFLIASKDDSIDGIFDTVKECAQISKWAGGIGIHIHDIRSDGSYIAGTNGTSSGVIPMLRVFNSTARYVNQAGRRKGSIAVYMEPWHGDIEGFLELRLNQGDEEARCRDLFTAMWIPDLFMKRVQENGKWSLFSPDKVRDLPDLYGDAFEEAYVRYEEEGLAVKTVTAMSIWQRLLKSQVETGTPYMVYKDAANRKSNQKNLGTIKSSNLCVAPETKILTDKGHIVISEVVDQKVNAWNGKEFTEVIPRRTGLDQPIMTVKTKYGNTLRCTPYHRFWVVGREEPLDAKDLEVGMNIEPIYDGMVYDTITYAKNLGERSDTYCFNEPKRHMGVFNGILTGQCSEIIEYTDKDETAVCNLASLGLPKFVNQKTRKFDFKGLSDATRVVTRNLNRVIDKNFYPTETSKRSNLRHRPIGIGVQGLADVYIMMNMTFDSEDAAALNHRIFETIYYGAVSESVEEAKRFGPYQTFKGSPASEGLLQFDLWDEPPRFKFNYDWNALKAEVVLHGMRNSLLVAPMPTASTSQILGNNECFEPYTSNMYLRRTLAGEFVVINKHLVKELVALGKWGPDVKNAIIGDNGSVKGLDIPDELKEKYKTVWEISQKVLIDQSADRGRFVCQSQSLNLFLEDPLPSRVSTMHMYAWKKGLKTGMYYLRTRPKARAVQVTLAATQDCEMCSA